MSGGLSGGRANPSTPPPPVDPGSAPMCGMSLLVEEACLVIRSIPEGNRTTAEAALLQAVDDLCSDGWWVSRRIRDADRSQLSAGASLSRPVSTS